MFWNKNKKSAEDEKSFYANLNPYAAKSARPKSELLKRITTKLGKSQKIKSNHQEAPLSEPSPVALAPGQQPQAGHPNFVVGQQAEAQRLHGPVPAHHAAVAEDSLPGLLVMQGVASPEQVDEALRRQQESGVFFGDALADMGAVTDTHLVGFLSKYCKLPHLSLLDYVVDKDTVSLIPASICWKYHVLPIDKMGRNLTVAMVNPLNEEARAEIARQCPAMRVKPILCTHKDFEVVAERFFGQRPGSAEKGWERSSASMQVLQTDGKTAPLKSTTSGDRSALFQNLSPENKGAVAPEKTVEPQAHPSSMNISINDRFVDNVFFDSGDQVESALAEAFTESPVSSKFRLGTTQDKADEIVKSFSSHEDLMTQYTEMMKESMRNSYELLARKIPFFHGIEAREVTKFFSHGKVRQYEFGQAVYEAGEFSSEMYVILNGCVELYDSTKEPIILHRGDIFGETALRGGEVRTEAARVIAHSSIMTVDFKSIRESLPPEVATQLLANIVMILGHRLGKVRRGQDISPNQWTATTEMGAQQEQQEQQNNFQTGD